ncbi:class I adenylate-forming enzyme family protein [Sinomonas cellulolyticus]|uniref:Acyl--CoA ligase n=1 Tax=Sinomonas cellulolyticus TaxID=2801916 RepID=A0ABS1JXU1_9MICC|nr:MULTISPECIES: class I adenylate-forming enzyme family protein [Sinomonas]MBL0703993.1 acyl--CoA ligase [Sinomonas cellulolyticus]
MARNGDNPALWDGSRWLSFGELRELASRAGGYLRGLGAQDQDRVLIACSNSPEFRVLELAVICEGMVRVALSSRLHVQEIIRIAADCDARIVVCDADRASGLAEALQQRGGIQPTIVAVGETRDAPRTAGPDPSGTNPPAGPIHRFDIGGLRRHGTSTSSPTTGSSDLVMLMYSSGSTGQPKAIPVTNRAWIAQTTLAGVCLPPIGPGDVVLAAAPMSHFGGSIGLDCTVRGAATVTMSTFRPADVFEAMERHFVTVLPLIPVMLRDLALAPEAAPQPQTRAVPYGGSGVSVDTLALAEKLFPGALHQFYGLAEALAPIASLSGAEHSRAVQRLGDPSTAEDANRVLSSAGRPLAEVEVRIGPRGDTREGPQEIYVRGDTVMTGYLGHAQEPAISAGSWFPTGDLGTLSADGLLTIAGRAKETIITGGFNVQPSEVEKVIEQLPGVAAAAVLGMPHPRWGEAVTAFVERSPRTGPAPQIEALDITAFCRAHLADYKKPKSVTFVDRLPRNSTGKIDRSALRNALAERGGDQSEPHTQGKEASCRL